MRNNKWICLAVLVMAAAVAASGCLGSQKQTSSAPKVELAKLQDEVILPDTTGADIELLSMENPIDFCYSTSDTDMIFKKKDGIWLDAMDTEIPLNQEKFQAMAENFLNLKAVSKVENAQNLSDYGLNLPNLNIYITDSEKGEVNIDIGAQDGAGNYYASINENGVYSIKSSAVEALVFDYDSLVIRETLDLETEAGDIQKASVTVEGKTTSYKPSDQEAMARIAEGIRAIEPVSYASYHILSQELTALDLTEDKRMTFQAEILVDGQTKALTIYVGAYADPEESLRYIQIDGSQMIMVVSEDAIKNLFNM